MTTKTKSSKPAANADGSKDQVRKAHIELWHSINLLKIIDLTTKEAVDGDARDNDVFLHAISTAAGHAVDRGMTAYAIIDRVAFVCRPRSGRAQHGLPPRGQPHLNHVA